MPRTQAQGRLGQVRADRCGAGAVAVADYDPLSGGGTLTADADVPARIMVPELGVEAVTGQAMPVRAVELDPEYPQEQI